MMNKILNSDLLLQTVLKQCEKMEWMKFDQRPFLWQIFNPSTIQVNDKYQIKWTHYEIIRT